MTERLSWLLMATHVPPDGHLGGMVRYVVELARELAMRPDVQLTVLTTAPTRTFFTSLLGSEEQVLTLPGLPTPVRSLLERSGLGVPAFRRGFDVVHGSKHLLPVTGRARKVLTVHDLLPIDRPQDFTPLKRWALVPPYRSSLRAADVLVCVSAATRARLLVDQPQVAPRTAVVPLAVSSDLSGATSRPVEGLAGTRFALVVGDASPRKNLRHVFLAWKQVVARDPGAVLVVVGPSGWGVDERGDAYFSLLAAGAVRPLGHVGDDQLRWCYENARVVACPSLLEGFGLPSVEALHFGAPLITSTDPALVEASGDRAEHLSATDVPAWADSLLRAMTRPRAHVSPGRSRTWGDVAEETVRAVWPQPT